MDKAEFRAHLKDNGYEDMGEKEMAANHVEPTHTHDFDAAILVLSGEISAVMEDRTVTCRAGDTFSLDANTPHEERIGGEGVRFLAGRREIG
ncbi:MAG: cupin domain-containing protein [Alphaproteobacteria bacterium]|jgi:quercetin dioxygenase-like cupin family protein|nr:cupin domain-containing protein [Alphaproteobacteria bacterium]MDP6831638.1 cupin domain-containing protein [Alphaproteobacteria bacterium]MDP6875764.1 cupin domain-containing protein [Alphaproteobacteria bacterium]